MGKFSFILFSSRWKHRWKGYDFGGPFKFNRGTKDTREGDSSCTTKDCSISKHGRASSFFFFFKFSAKFPPSFCSVYKICHRFYFYDPG